MSQLSLLLLAVVAIGLSDGLIRGRGGPRGPGGVSSSRRTYCSEKVDTLEHCPVDDKPLLRTIATEGSPDTGREVMDALRNAGPQQLCEELDAMSECVVSMLKNALEQCDDVFGDDFREHNVIAMVETGHSFQQEVCSPQFGDWAEHWDCFTEYDLQMSTLNCIRHIRRDFNMNNFINCVHEEMDEYPDICDEGAKDLAAKFIRRGAQVARPFLTKLYLPEKFFLKKLLKY